MTSPGGFHADFLTDIVVPEFGDNGRLVRGCHKDRVSQS